MNSASAWACFRQVIALGSVLLAALGSPVLAAEAVSDGALPAPTGAQFIPGAAEIAMLGSLATAREGLAQLETAETEQERAIAYSTAIDALTALYQLHGLEWAGPELERLYAQPDCPWLLSGYSTDGRLLLRVQALELQNPAFENHTVVLCTLASHTALELEAEVDGALACELTGGAQLPAKPLNKEHELWPQLAWGEESFTAPEHVPSGFSHSFKQIFAMPILSIHEISAVILEWGQYRIELRRPVAQAAVVPGGG